MTAIPTHETLGPQPSIRGRSDPLNALKGNAAEDSGIWGWVWIVLKVGRGALGLQRLQRDCKSPYWELLRVFSRKVVYRTVQPCDLDPPPKSQQPGAETLNPMPIALKDSGLQTLNPRPEDENSDLRSSATANSTAPTPPAVKH